MRAVKDMWRTTRIQPEGNSFVRLSARPTALLFHVVAYFRIIPYFDEDVSVFQNFLTLTTRVTVTL